VSVTDTSMATIALCTADPAPRTVRPARVRIPRNVQDACHMPRMTRVENASSTVQVS
jgi:hypothetical protein